MIIVAKFNFRFYLIVLFLFFLYGLRFSQTYSSDSLAVIEILHGNDMFEKPVEYYTDSSGGRITRLVLIEHLDTLALPPCIGGLTELITLNLMKNNIKSLPQEFWGLMKLETLQLAVNQLCSIPKEIGNLGRLKFLDIYSNKLTILPVAIGGLVELEYLNVSGNNLQVVPSEIKSLTHLKWLLLGKNSLNSLEKEICHLQNLIYLDLSENNLPLLPAEIGNLVNLDVLFLNHNSMSSLPLEIMDLSRMANISGRGQVGLFIGHNKLCNLPDTITDWLDSIMARSSISDIHLLSQYYPGDFYYEFWDYAQSCDSVKSEIRTPGSMGPVCASPNPFNSAIEFDVKKELEIYQIKIFNASGRMVDVLDVRDKQKIMWNATGCGSGLYVVRLIGKCKVVTKSILYFK